MINRSIKLFPVLAVWMLSSCCSTEDSRVAKGYPFGNTHELNFSEFKFPCSNQSSNYSYFGPSFITDKRTCDSVLINLDCNCDSINFNKNILAHLHGHIEDTYSVDIGYSPRVIINHDSKNYTIELRGFSRTCSGSPPNYNLYRYDELLIIPKPPDNYHLEVKCFSPVHED